MTFFLFFLIIDLYFLIHAVITQMFNPTEELAIPTETSTTEAKAEIERHSEKVEAKISVRVFL